MIPAELKEAFAVALHRLRTEGRSRPQGKAVAGRMWAPTELEMPDLGDLVVIVPDASIRFSALAWCKMLPHCRALVDRAIAGDDVPLDVWTAIRSCLPVQPDTEWQVVRDIIENEVAGIDWRRHLAQKGGE